MEFRILGPLEVWEEGGKVSLVGRKPRALLALLLLHPNEVVHTDRLIDELWGEDSPESAAAALRVNVSRLRKALPQDVLSTRSPGYVIRVEPDELDLHRFERLVNEGRSLLARGLAAGASERLRDALSLWRGPALADFTYETFAQATIARLEEIRLAALELRIDADLALGRHNELVGEVEALVAEHPLRERLRGQLMLALYRSGRQADALNAYADVRRHLVDELGIEPGPELQGLQRRILAHDPELGRISAPRPLTARRRARWLIGVGTLLVAGAAAGAAIELIGGRGGPAALSSVVPDSLAVLDPKTNKLVGQVKILGGPSLVAAGQTDIWVVSDASRTISSIAATKRAVTHVVAASASPDALGADGDAVWVLDGDRRVLLRIEATYGAVTRRIQLPRARAVATANARQRRVSVSAGAGALWVTDGSTRLLRADPDSGRVSDPLDVREPLDDVAVGGGTVWAISGRAASVFQIDPQTRVVKTRINIVHRVGTTAPFPIAVVVGEGSVWVLNGNTQSVSRIDPEFGGVTATIPLGIGRNPTDIAAGAGAVWVTNGGDGTLTRIDSRTNATSTIGLGGSPVGVAVGAGRVWVTVQPGFRARARSPVEPAGGAEAETLPLSNCSPVEFQGKGRPRYLIASDLPIQGLANLRQTAQMSDAIRFVLTKRHFTAGPFSMGYQSCDDSIAATGSYHVDKCKANARAYAATKRVIGVIGSFNSGCTQVQLATLAAASGGPLAMISPANTYVGLTHAGPGTAPDEPQKYYPHGVRNFVRVVAADDLQGAANALLAQQLGSARLFVLHDGDPYGFGIAHAMRQAATKLGLIVAGYERWDPDARSYTELALMIRATHADAVFLGGTSEGSSNGAALVKDLRSVLGRRVRILTPDGFTPISRLVQVLGPAAEGVTVSFPAAPPERLRGKGRRFVVDFGRAIGRPVEAYSVAAAQATETLLDAIAKSDGSRASVTAQLFKSKVTDGILGTFSFDRNGDTTAGAVTIYRIVRGKPTIFRVITPSPGLAH